MKSNTWSVSPIEWMAWPYRFPQTALPGRKSVGNLLPDVRKSGPEDEVLYYHVCNGQFDDAQLKVNIARTPSILVEYSLITSSLQNFSKTPQAGFVASKPCTRSWETSIR